MWTFPMVAAPKMVSIMVFRQKVGASWVILVQNLGRRSGQTAERRIWTEVYLSKLSSIANKHLSTNQESKGFFFLGLGHYWAIGKGSIKILWYVGIGWNNSELARSCPLRSQGQCTCVPSRKGLVASISPGTERTINRAANASGMQNRAKVRAGEKEHLDGRIGVMVVCDIASSDLPYQCILEHCVGWSCSSDPTIYVINQFCGWSLHNEVSVHAYLLTSCIVG